MVSVIIPTLNEEHNLSKNLPRITNQADEVIVADAHSSDATRQIAKQHGCTVVDGGLPAKARNNGFEASNGDQLFFLDADVKISENFFEKAIRERERRGADILIFRNTPYTQKDISTLKRIGMNLSFSVANALIRLSTYSSNPKGIGRAMHFTRECFDDIGGFDEDLYLFEDFEVTERAKTHGFDTMYSNDQEVQVDGTKMVEEGVISHTYRIYKAYFHRIYKSIVSRNQYMNITDDNDYFTTNEG